MRDMCSEIIDDLISNAHNIEIANHNFATSPEEWVTLQEIMDSHELAGNNCFAVASQIEEETDEKFLHGEFLFKDCKSHHCSIFTDTDEQKIVIDFTAHQYDETLPCPLVTDPNTWKNLIEQRTIANYGPKAVITDDTFNKIFD